MSSNVKKGTGGSVQGGSAVVVRPSGVDQVSTADGAALPAYVHVGTGGSEGGGTAEFE